MKTPKKLLSLVLIAAMLVSSLCIGVSATGTYDAVSIGEGEPVTITWTNAYEGSIVNVDGGTYIPASFLLWVEGTSTVTVGTTAVTAGITNDGNSGYVITTGSAAQTITVSITESSMGAAGTYTITCPAQNGTAPASIVSSVVGYLPVGQFARGTGWGSATGKFTTSSYASTGVSLGAAGGYIQMELSSPIYNLGSNPYGVDFVVYGNAFNGNPEAGAVKVFGYKAGETTGAWYDLAGSLYYNSVSKNNATVSYKKVETTDSTFTETGIWYQVNGGTWTKFTSNTAWWPDTSEGYGDTWGDVDGVTWDQTDNIITYTGVSLVKDIDTTNDYQFGYFDVHVNGSSYGTAQNPYTITNTQSGGDGFDIAWAVDSNGAPAGLSYITKVRLYTAAALTSDGTAFTTPGIFGETSAEVCGVFKATGTGSASTTKDLVIRNSAGTVVNTSNMEVSEIANGTVQLTSEADNVYVNGVLVDDTSYSFTISVGQMVQIITQSGNESPYITVLKGV